MFTWDQSRQCSNIDLLILRTCICNIIIQQNLIALGRTKLGVTNASTSDRNGIFLICVIAIDNGIWAIQVYITFGVYAAHCLAITLRSINTDGSSIERQSLLLIQPLTKLLGLWFNWLLNCEPYNIAGGVKLLVNFGVFVFGNIKGSCGWA